METIRLASLCLFLSAEIFDKQHQTVCLPVIGDCEIDNAKLKLHYSASNHFQFCFRYRDTRFDFYFWQKSSHNVNQRSTMAQREVLRKSSPDIERRQESDGLNNFAEDSDLIIEAVLMIPDSRRQCRACREQR
jgi:hypothetical protein